LKHLIARARVRVPDLFDHGHFPWFWRFGGHPRRAVAAEATNSVRERYMVFYKEKSMVYMILGQYFLRFSAI